jgi:hypothetical protein
MLDLQDTELGRVYGRWEVDRSDGKARTEKNIWLEGGTPRFFVSVASKELRQAESLL